MEWLASLLPVTVVAAIALFFVKEAVELYGVGKLMLVKVERSVDSWHVSVS